MFYYPKYHLNTQTMMFMTLREIDNIDSYIDMNESHSLSQSENLLSCNSVHTDCKYYTIGDFSKDFKSFNGESFIHYNARSLGANISRVRESLQRLSFDFLYSCHF